MERDIKEIKNEISGLSNWFYETKFEEILKIEFRKLERRMLINLIMAIKKVIYKKIILKASFHYENLEIKLFSRKFNIDEIALKIKI